MTLKASDYEVAGVFLHAARRFGYTPLRNDLELYARTVRLSLFRPGWRIYAVVGVVIDGEEILPSCDPRINEAAETVARVFLDALEAVLAPAASLWAESVRGHGYSLSSLSLRTNRETIIIRAELADPAAADVFVYDWHAGSDWRTGANWDDDPRLRPHRTEFDRLALALLASVQGVVMLGQPLPDLEMPVERERP